jgi:hypothetical protein
VDHRVQIGISLDDRTDGQDTAARAKDANLTTLRENNTSFIENQCYLCRGGEGIETHDFRLGSEDDVAAFSGHVWFTPDSGHPARE